MKKSDLVKQVLEGLASGRLTDRLLPAKIELADDRLVDLYLSKLKKAEPPPMESKKVHPSGFTTHRGPHTYTQYGTEFPRKISTDPDATVHTLTDGSHIAVVKRSQHKDDYSYRSTAPYLITHHTHPPTPEEMVSHQGYQHHLVADSHKLTDHMMGKISGSGFTDRHYSRETAETQAEHLAERLQRHLNAGGMINPQKMNGNSNIHGALKGQHTPENAHQAQVAADHIISDPGAYHQKMYRWDSEKLNDVRTHHPAPGHTIRIHRQGDTGEDPDHRYFADYSIEGNKIASSYNPSAPVDHSTPHTALHQMAENVVKYFNPQLKVKAKRKK